MKYKTCVSIAEKNPKKIKHILKIALGKSEYAEVRLDFLKPSDIPNVLESIKNRLPRCVSVSYTHLTLPTILLV